MFNIAVVKGDATGIVFRQEEAQPGTSSSARNTSDLEEITTQEVDGERVMSSLAVALVRMLGGPNHPRHMPLQLGHKALEALLWCGMTDRGGGISGGQSEAGGIVEAPQHQPLTQE